MKLGSEQHEQELQKFKQELEGQGYRVILLRSLSPDGIAVKDDKIVAVECLGEHYRKKKNYWRPNGGLTLKGKKEQYRMFDDVLFRLFQYPKRQYPHELKEELGKTHTP